MELYVEKETKNLCKMIFKALFLDIDECYQETLKKYIKKAKDRAKCPEVQNYTLYFGIIRSSLLTYRTVT
jgi:hypothetical protein